MIYEFITYFVIQSYTEKSLELSRGVFNKASAGQNSLYPQHKFWRVIMSACSVELASNVNYATLHINI